MAPILTLDADIVERYAPRMAGMTLAVVARYYRLAGEQAAEKKGRQDRALYLSIREAARLELIARGIELG